MLFYKKGRGRFIFELEMVAKFQRAVDYASEDIESCPGFITF